MLDISGGELVTKEANSIGTGRICKGAKPLSFFSLNFSLYLAPVPAMQINHPDCDFKAMSTFHSSLRRNKRGDPRFFPRYLLRTAQ